MLSHVTLYLVRQELFTWWCPIIYSHFLRCQYIYRFSFWLTLSLIDVYWCWLMLMVWPLTVTPGVIHVGGYHRPSDGSQVPHLTWQSVGSNTLKTGKSPPICHFVSDQKFDISCHLTFHVILVILVIIVIIVTKVIMALMLYPLSRMELLRS